MSNDTIPNTECSEINDRIAHRKAIKDRIVKAVQESGYSAYQLHTLVSKSTARGNTANSVFDYQLSYPTFLQTCNPEHENICNLDACLAIARFLKLPLDNLFAPPDEDVQLGESKVVTFPIEPFRYLADPKYFGTFHGYMHSLNSKENVIEPFTLHINEHGATMRIHYHTTTTENVREPSVLDLAGSVIQVKDENVYTVLTNKDGNFVILAFAYQEYTKKNLYFRRGALMASGRGTDRNPYVQSFILFDHDIQEKEKQYLPGLLLLTERDFHIPVVTAKEIAKTDPDVDALLTVLSRHIRQEKYYVLREETLMTCDNSRISKDEILAALLKLKASATDATQSYFPHETAYSRFSLTLKKNLTEE